MVSNNSADSRDFTALYEIKLGRLGSVLKKCGLGRKGIFVLIGMGDEYFVKKILRAIARSGRLYRVNSFLNPPDNDQKQKHSRMINFIEEKDFKSLFHDDVQADVVWFSLNGSKEGDVVDLISQAFSILKDGGTVVLPLSTESVSVYKSQTDLRDRTEEMTSTLVTSGFSDVRIISWNNSQSALTARKPGAGRYICAPVQSNMWTKMLVGSAEKFLKRSLEANRILKWSPRNLLGSGIMEMLVTHHDKEIPDRIMNLIRIFVSFRVSCAFCIDLNSAHFKKQGITEDEIMALRDDTVGKVQSFSAKEVTVIAYARSLCQTPVRIPQSTIEQMKTNFSDRVFTIIAVTVAQVNFWARFIQGLGVGEAGFSENQEVLELEKFQTRI